MYVKEVVGSENRYDVILVGAGIMSSTLAVLLHELEPDMRILMIERLEAPGLESSAAANNAGTGHAANCELNYTPLTSNGLVNTKKALSINKAFERSLEFWASLTEAGVLNPKEFLHLVPHISLVWGEDEVAFLRQRYRQLSSLEAFSSMEWSNDSTELRDWMPLVMEGRQPSQKLAATRIKRGMDIDFGFLTVEYLKTLQANGALELQLNTEVVNLKQINTKAWQLDLQGLNGTQQVETQFVFLGAGGGALSLLQKSSIPESLVYGGFPVSGQWLVCSDCALTEQHHAKVYGKARVGAPPMSVPHLDSRWINGERSLLFGPYAGFTTKFLKEGSGLDLFRSVRINNFSSMFQVGWRNFDLVKYLFSQLRLSEADRLDALKDFLPNAKEKDWRLVVAGQRVQIIKRTSEGGCLQMGTEVVSSADGTLAALLGASPGASTAVTIMLEVLERCWGEQMQSDRWQKKLEGLFPSFGQEPNFSDSLLIEMRQRSDFLLDLA